jgi:hypothetical protein
MRSVLFALALAACRPPAATGPIDSPPPPPGAIEFACIPPAAGTRVTNAVADGTRIRYCIGDSDQCFVIDPDSTDVRSFARIAKPAPAPQGAYTETTPPRIEVCNSVDCTSLTNLVLPKVADIRAATSPDGAFAAFLFGGTAANGYVELWDVTTSKKISTVRYARGGFQCGDIAMLGQTLLVKASVCGSPAQVRGALFNVAGKKLADVGGKDFVIGPSAQIDDTTWAFLEDTGRSVAIQDVARGTLKKLVDTSGVFLIGAANQGGSGESALVQLGDGRLAVIAGSPAVGSVATVDPKTFVVELRQAPLCR